MISVGIIGGTGYTGKYIIKFCNEHPHVKGFSIYANKSASKKIHEIFPDFVNEVEDQTIYSINDLDLSHDLYIVALPSGESLKYVPLILSANKKVIDLGTDYRLDTKELFYETYKLVHTSPEYLKTKIYGLPEFVDTYTDVNLIANPGCYPTSVLLSTIPVVKNLGNSIRSISTVSYSGFSGAGKKASRNLLFAENYNSVKAYNVGTHRHEPEIEQELKKYNENIDFSLTTHLLPIFSGIYSTTIIHLSNSVTQNIIDEIFLNDFSDKTFIRQRQIPPELKWVIGTNYCDIYAKSVQNKIIITAAIDNLIKGASGQAIQNMNKLYGWEDFLGIKNSQEKFENV